MKAAALVVLVLAVAVSGTCHAEALLAFAKRTADKFPAQVPASTFAEHLTARTAITHIGMNRSVDAPTRTLVFAYKREDIRLPMLQLWSSCKETGPSYVGRNAFNAQVRVTREACDQVRLRGPDDKLPIGMIYRDVFGVKIHGLSPTVARQTHHFDVVLHIEPVAPTDGDYVTIKESFSMPPTLDDPRDVKLTRYTISGKVTGVDYFLPGSTTPFASRDPHLDEFAE